MSWLIRWFTAQSIVFRKDDTCTALELDVVRRLADQVEVHEVAAALKTSVQDWRS